MWWMLAILLSCTSVMAYLGARLFAACDAHESEQVWRDVLVDEELRAIKQRLDKLENRDD